MPIASTARWIASQGFNAVRIPLAMSEVLAGEAGHGSSCLNPAVYTDPNPELLHLSYLDGLAAWIRVLGDHGLLVLLDMHVDAAGAWPDAGTIRSETALTSAWLALSRRFCLPHVEYWNVFAADLKNEPHSMTWGAAKPNAPASLYPPTQRWDLVASRLASTLHQHCGRWLHFVEGVGHCVGESTVYGCKPGENREGGLPPFEPGDPRCGCKWFAAAGQLDVETGGPPASFWGENLQGAAVAPVVVRDASGRTVPGKIVYSPHSYGPAVYMQSFFRAEDFPSNMPRIWDASYGRLAIGGTAIVVGEWGGRIEDELDASWQRAFANYLRERSIGGFYWSLNPESADTGGVLSSWRPLSGVPAKLELLSSLPTTRVPTSHDRVWSTRDGPAWEPAMEAAAVPAGEPVIWSAMQSADEPAAQPAVKRSDEPTSVFTEQHAPPPPQRPPPSFGTSLLGQQTLRMFQRSPPAPNDPAAAVSAAESGAQDDRLWLAETGATVEPAFHDALNNQLVLGAIAVGLMIAIFAWYIERKKTNRYDEPQTKQGPSKGAARPSRPTGRSKKGFKRAGSDVVRVSLEEDEEDSPEEEEERVHERVATRAGSVVEFEDEEVGTRQVSREEEATSSACAAAALD